jgi:hypothetical protein
MVLAATGSEGMHVVTPGGAAGLPVDDDDSDDEDSDGDEGTDEGGGDGEGPALDLESAPAVE